MKKRLLVALFSLFSFVQLVAQDIPSFSVTGKVMDKETSQTLEYATIILSPKPSGDIIGGITDKKGSFKIDVTEGNYDITIEFLSYKSKKITKQEIDNDINLGTIQLEIDAETLENVEIIGEKKLVERKLGKYIYNVTNDISADGNTIIGVMNNLPSVILDNGVPMIRGQAATIMINGRTSSMTKSEALNSMPAGSVEKIEVITNPGAQYNASFQSIINIILKKGKDEGLNASLTSSIGHKDIYGGLLTLNHKSEKVNFFTNTSFNHKNVVWLSDSENEYFLNGVTSSFLDEHSDFDSKNNVFYTTVGTDFYLSKKTTLTTSINYFNLDRKSETLTSSYIYNAARIETSYNYRDHLGYFKNEAIEFVGNLEHEFKKEGKTLSSYIMHTRDVENNNDNIINTNVNYTDEIYSRSNKLLNTLIDIKFNNPISEKASYTIGYFGDFGKVPFRNSGTLVNQNTDYAENINAGFIELNGASGKLTYRLGVRGEFSERTIDYLNINVKQKRSTNDFIPNAYIEYALKENQSTSIAYKRNIYRTRTSQLQPFEEKYSETSSYIGNEQLKPMYVDTYTIDYAFFGDKLKFIPSISYVKLNDYWQEVTYETGEHIDGVKKLITTPQNVGHVNYYLLDIFASLKVNENLNFSFNPIFNYFDQRGIFETTNMLDEPVIIDYNQKNINGTFNFSSQLKIPNAFNFQMNVTHHLISKGPVSTRKAYTYASAAISKDLFDKNATLSLTTNDIFNSNQTKRDRFDINYFSKSNIRNKYQNIILSFTYRFNQSKKNRKIDFDKKDTKPNF